LLFFAYVLLSTALLLGSRQALVLTLIAGGTICAVTLSQAYNQITPVLHAPQAFSLPLMLSLTLLALGLIAYVARLFSLNLDRFTHESARQSEDLLHQRLQFSQQEHQLTEELEALNEDLTQYLKGKTQTRISEFFEMLAPVQKNLNAVLEQGEKLLYAAAYTNRLQERIAALKQALERANIGDRSAVQILASSSKTTLDTLTQPLVSICQQWFELQQAFQRARAEYQSLASLTADLAMLHQSLGSTDAVFGEMSTRSTQGARHLHALLESEGTAREYGSGSLNNERPILREMELRAHQQSSGLEMLRARLRVISERMEYIEGELRKVGEGMEQALRLPTSSRPMPRFPERPEVTGPKISPRATNPLTPPPFRAPSQHLSGPLTPQGSLPDADGPHLIH
jgi:hypothetical protein